MGIPPTGGRDGGGRTTGGVDLSIPTLEHGCTVYCNQSHYVPVSGSEAEARVKGAQAVVVPGRVVCGRDADGGSGGRMDGWVGGDGRDGDVIRLSQWK